MTTAIQIATRLLVLPVLLASASAMAGTPATKAVRRTAPMSARSARRLVAGVMAGSVLAFGVQAANAADAEVQAPDASVATMNLTTARLNLIVPKMAAQPNYAELANAQLRAQGIGGKSPEQHQTIAEKMNKGFLDPLHKIADGNDWDLARFLTDSKHMRYGYNFKKHEFSVEYRATW